VTDQDQIAGPVEEWLEYHRSLFSPNTIKSYATALALWFSYLDLRSDAARWDDVGVPAFAGFLSWYRAGGDKATYEVGSDQAARELSPATVESRQAAVLSFYRFHAEMNPVPVAAKVHRAAPRSTRGLAERLGRREVGGAPLVRVRMSQRRKLPPILMPAEIDTILDACAVYDRGTGDWAGDLRSRFLFALLAESGLRLGEALGLRVGDWVMGRGGTPYVEVVARDSEQLDARVKRMRSRRVYVSPELEQLYSDYVSSLAEQAARHGTTLTSDSPLFMNLRGSPKFGQLRAGSVYDVVARLRKQGVGPTTWSPHWFRHTHATALLLAGRPDWVVARRLGHARVETLHQLYAWVTEDEALRAAVDWQAHVAHVKELDD
jgi:integrase